VLSGFDQGFEEGLPSRLRFARGPERRRSSLGMPPFILRTAHFTRNTYSCIKSGCFRKMNSMPTVEHAKPTAAYSGPRHTSEYPHVLDFDSRPWLEKHRVFTRCRPSCKLLQRKESKTDRAMARSAPTCFCSACRSVLCIAHPMLSRLTPQARR